MRGVQLVVSDDHSGLKAARQATMPGVPWQRCQFHTSQNAMAHVPKISMRAGSPAQTRLGDPQRDQRRLGNRTVLPQHQSQVTRLLIPAFTEEGLLYLDLFPTMREMMVAIDEVRRQEVVQMRRDGYEPAITSSRPCLLKRGPRTSPPIRPPSSSSCRNRNPTS